MSRVAFLCCHLTGTGHLVRTLALARAVRAVGGEVLVISGGVTPVHLDGGDVPLVELPPLHVPDFDFSTPRRPDGAPADAAYLAARERAIRAALAEFAPDVLVTETWPLGRRRLSPEFEAAIAAARAAREGVRICASVRDVPEPPKVPGRIEEAAGRLARDFDALFVHGEAEFLPLSASWPLPATLTPMVHHTGYVASEGPPPGEERGDEVLVAVGGGVLGRRLLALAAEAAMETARPWRLLAGGPDAGDVAADLAARFARTGLVIEPARPDYRALLARAACSVSLVGYNTVMELAACTTPAILVPFDEFGEREQVIRAERLAAFPGVRVLRLGELTPEGLARAAEAAAAGPRRPPLPLARDGAARAAAKIMELAGR